MRILIALSLASLLLAVGCTKNTSVTSGNNPSSQQITVLMATGSLSLKSQLNAEQDTLLHADSVKADSAFFTLRRSDSFVCPINLDTLPTQRVAVRFGPLPLSNVPIAATTITASAGSFTNSTTVALGGISTVTFDAGSPSLSCTLTNTSAAAITGLKVTLLGTTQTAASLAANSSTSLLFPVAGGAISGGALPVSVQGSAGASSKITLQFNFNGLTASYAQVKDSFLSIAKQDTLDFALPDSFSIDYLDILAGTFIYKYQNYTKIPLDLSISQLNLWNSAYCMQNSLQSAAGLATAAGSGQGLDSTSFYFGRTSSIPFSVSPSQAFACSLKVNLSGLRLFPIWNPTLGNAGRSAARIVYTVATPAPSGNMFTVSESDSMALTVAAPNFKFNALAGTITKSHIAMDTESVPIPFPWNGSANDTLRRHFTLTGAAAEMAMTVVLPDSTLLSPRRASFDSLDMTFEAFTRATPRANAAARVTLQNVVNTTTAQASIPVDTVLNQSPDSMYIVRTLVIPANAHFCMVNELTNPAAPSYNLWMGEMMLGIACNASMKAALNWQGTDTGIFDLGRGVCNLPRPRRAVAASDGLHLTAGMQVANQSGMGITFHALIAPRQYQGALFALPADTLFAVVADTARAHRSGFIDIFGSPGTIAASDSSTIGPVNLSQWQLDSLLGADSAVFRYIARVTVPVADTLPGSGSVQVIPTLYYNGTSTLDSLLIWP